MNILKPEVVWIEGRCYRVNEPITEITAFREHDLYEDETYVIAEDEGEDDVIDVVMVDNSRYSTSCHVPKHYVGSIIGKKGAIKMRLERDTKTDIKIPKQGQPGDVVILGPTEESVKAARRKINIIVMSSRMRQRPTHFLSIPMNNAEIITNFENFKARVLEECPSKGVEDSVFIRAAKLHLTLGVMCLMDNEERLQVSKLLSEAKEKIVDPLLQNHQPLKIKLKGLSYMNDDPHQIKVLYGCVEELGGPAGLLQTLADQLVDHFYKAGFMDRSHGRDNVKLHVTLLNSKYRYSSDPESESANKKWEPFDGSEILKKFADYDFGVAELRDLHLSQRHCMGPDGYYQPTCIIPCYPNRVE